MTLSVTVLSAIMLSFGMLSVAIFYNHECHNAECRYAKSRGAFFLATLVVVLSSGIVSQISQLFKISWQIPTL